MAVLAVCQRKIFSSLFRPLFHLPQLRPYTPLVRTQLKFASSGKQPKSWKNNTVKKSALDNTDEQESPQLIKLFDEAGLLVPVVKKDEAKKMAKLKDLRLVQISEDKLEPHYQLMTGKQLLEAQLKQKKSKKQKPSVEKTVQLNSNISEHDLVIKLNKIKSLLEKNFNIRMKIKLPYTIDEIESRQIQSKLLKRVTEETSLIATMKEVSSKATELALILRKKDTNT